MTKIFLDGDNIKRHVCLNFDFTAPVSYEDFCHDPGHHRLFEKIFKQDLMIFSESKNPIKGHNFGGWIDQNIINKQLIALNYDIIEEYKGIVPYSSRIEKLGYTHFPQNKEIYDMFLNYELDIIKHYITDNYVIGGEKNRTMDEIFSAKLLNPAFLSKLENNNEIIKHKERRNIATEKVSFEQSIEKNFKIEYIIFISFLLRERLYFVVDQDFLRFSIVEESRLWKYTSFSTLIQHIDPFYRMIENDKTKDMIKKLRSEYYIDNISLETVTNDVIEMIEMGGSWTIRLDAREGKILKLKGRFDISDTERYNEFKKYTEDNGNVAYDNRKGISTRIVGEKRFLYNENKPGK